MSLQLAAQHLSSHGRGNDSTLVHMSPREVKSLNDLAMIHGGRLTTNPHTGLPEAGFLESILPVVAGAALMAAGVPAGYAALGVGAGATLMTGSLEKGLMAGLGAYGGAGLGEGLLASGTDAAVASAPEVAAAQQNAAAQMQKFYNPTSQTLDPGGLEAIQKASADTAAAQAAARNAAAPDFMSKIQAMGKGIGSLGEEGGISNLYQNLGGSPMSLIKTVGSAAAPSISGAMAPKQLNQAPAGDADMGQRYGFSMNPTYGQPQQTQPGQNPPGTPQTTTPFPTSQFDSSEKRYFTPSYTKLTPEQAKLIYGFADGGPIDGDPAHLPLNENEKYPGSYMHHYMYGNTAAQPFGQDVVDGSTDALMSPMTRKGYADGGVANEDRPTETPALQMFKQMQAQRADQAKAAQAPQYNPATGGAIFTNGPTPTTVEGLYSTYLGRAPEKEGLEHWNKEFGPTVDAREAGIFRNSAENELAANLPTPNTVEGLYRTYLGRTPDKGGLDFWNKQFGPDVDANEAAIFRGGAAPELAANRRLAEQTGGGLAHEYGEYLRQARGEPNQLQAPTMPPPTTTNLADSGFSFDPITQRYTEIKAATPAAADTSPENTFNSDNYQVIGHTASGQEIYGGLKPYRFGGFGIGTGGAAAGGLMAAYAGGGISNLGDYSDGGRLLRGPGDGVSDSIPAMIGKKQPARLADGEFVVPARIVSELGNGSTEAGARKLYAMMDRIQSARSKTVGKGKVAKNSRAEKYLPA